VAGIGVATSHSREAGIALLGCADPKNNADVPGNLRNEPPPYRSSHFLLDRRFACLDLVSSAPLRPRLNSRQRHFRSPASAFASALRKLRETTDATTTLPSRDRFLRRRGDWGTQNERTN